MARYLSHRLIASAYNLPASACCPLLSRLRAMLLSIVIFSSQYWLMSGSQMDKADFMYFWYLSEPQWAQIMAILAQEKAISSQSYLTFCWICNFCQIIALNWDNCCSSYLDMGGSRSYQGFFSSLPGFWPLNLKNLRKKERKLVILLKMIRPMLPIPKSISQSSDNQKQQKWLCFQCKEGMIRNRGQILN